MYLVHIPDMEPHMEPLQLSPASIYRPPASQALTSTTKVQLKREIEDDCISAAMPHKKMRHDNELDVTPKRERKIEACLWCRERKVKCSRDKPTCERCQRDKKDCVYWGYEGEDKTTAEITNCTIRKIKDESRNLARTARKEAYRAKSRNVGGDELDDSERSDDEDVPDDHEYFSRTSPIATGNVTINGDDPYDQKFPCRTPPIAAGVVSEDNAEPEDQKYPMPTPLVTADAVYADDAECEGFGVQFGKCRISDRIGGFFRPKMAEELTQTLEANNHGAPSPEIHQPNDTSSILDPSPDYIASSTHFLFSQTKGLDDNSLGQHLPARLEHLAGRFLEYYWSCVHPVARTVHKPSFEKRYDAFWKYSRQNMVPPPSMQALVLAALFSGAVSMPEDVFREIGREERDSKKFWIETLEKLTAYSLGRANVVRTTNLETIQAFVMYLIPMCRGEVSRAHATLVASAVRIAECAGLNKDGIEQNWSPITTHVGRMIWHQLCFLDIRAFEAQCPRAIIRKGFFTTRFPLNVDDTELERPNPPQRDAKKWTDMTLSRIRMECNELLREIYFDRERVGPEPDQISVPEILRKVHRFRIQMKKKYMTMIDDSSPVQHYGRLNLELHPRRTYAIVLHPYHMSVTETMPAPLREAMINAGLETMEIVQEIETSADLRPWSWYKGALQSHHYALLLLVEFFVYPEHPEAERAWRSLEWVFDVPHCIPRAEKGRYVVTRVRDKMDKYVKARRLRCPREMEEKMMVSEQEKSPMPIVSREEDRETLLTGGSRLTGTVSATLTQANTDSSNINFDSYLQTRDTILPAQERFSHQRQVASHNVSGPGDLPMTYDDVPRCVPDSLPKVPNAKTKVFPMNFAEFEEIFPTASVPSGYFESSPAEAMGRAFYQPMIPTYGINGGNIPMEAAIPQYNHVRFNGIPHLDDG